MKLLLCVCLSVLLPAAFSGPAPGTPNKYKICVPDAALASCQELAAQHGIRLTCVAARDRLECLDKVQEHKADFVPADPEDMYLAAHIPEQHFTVFKEIRTTEEPNEDFRYEAVAVVHKDQPFNSIQDLRGLKSCHTGVGRNVGYKIPITKLTKLGVLNANSDPTLSARENELKALSQLFSKACLVGKWSSDPTHNQRLKTTYANLCQMCEHPDKCDYPDNFSGYDGALRCLSDNGGQVAWTKVYYVKKHFGIPIGAQEPLTVTTPTSYNPSDYAYLCPDGTKKPILGKACRWAARPWQGFLANGDLTSDVDDLKEQITLANTIGEENDSEWLSKVLTLMKNKTVTSNNPSPPLSPQAYLDRANYTDVIERGSGGGRASIRFCATSEIALAKCRTLKRAAFSRDVRPEFDCVLEASLNDCLAKIRDGAADVITLDGGEAHTAHVQYNLRPIITEVYGEHEGLYYAVAVVKKSSTYHSLADLKGAKSCHTAYGRTAGWNVPIYTLITKGLINSTCPLSKPLAGFFSGGSCVPGALASENNPQGDNPSKLCDLCVGDIDNPNHSTSQTSKCSATAEAYLGYTGAFRCLATGSGDVAFVKHTTVSENTDGHNKATWAASLKSSDYELLCPDGSRKPVDQYVSCNLAEVPAHVMVTASTKTENQVDDIRHAVITAADLYSKRPELFKLFGSYGGKKDLLFKDSATGLKSITGVSQTQERYNTILAALDKCKA